MSFISDLFAGGAGKLVDSVGNALDKVITTKEEKMQLENEMKKADLEFRLEMEKLSVAEQKLVFDDLSSARDRDAKVQASENATRLAKNVSPYLALGTTVLTFSLFYILLFKPDILGKNQEKKDILIYILGVLSAILTQIYSFYFGSSQGSQAKNKLIEEMQRKQI
jgi:hypothetical protein